MVSRWMVRLLLSRLTSRLVSLNSWLAEMVSVMDKVSSVFYLKISTS